MKYRQRIFGTTECSLAHDQIDAHLEAAGVSVKRVVVHDDVEHKAVVARLIGELTATPP